VKNLAVPSDEELMLKAQAGNSQAFEDLALRISPKLLGFLLKHVSDQDLAEDLLQETLLRVWRGRQQYHADSRVSTWIFAVALNLCRDHFRRLKPQSSLQDEAVRVAAEHSRWAGHSALPEEEASRAETAGQLLKALQALPPLSRQVLELRDQDASFKQIAQTLGMNPASARSVASRAYRRLRDALMHRKRGLGGRP
jgi:RNA polymerase sigma-70 factor (ECF subfamily)